jgi:AcrR family transcriptional regulator
MAYPSKTDRETILATAMALVSRDGIDQLAVRSVATALGLAPNALYRYFSSLADLKDELSDESRRRLLAVLKEASRDQQDLGSVRRMAHAYVQFARDHPHVFALTLLPSSFDDEDSSHRQSWRFVVDQVASIYGPEQAQEAAVALWAFLHGITVLESAGVFGDQKPSSGFQFGLEMWIQAGRPAVAAGGPLP